MMINFTEELIENIAKDSEAAFESKKQFRRFYNEAALLVNKYRDEINNMPIKKHEKFKEIIRAAICTINLDKLEKFLQEERLPRKDEYTSSWANIRGIINFDNAQNAL